ncbi:MAG: PAS domain-containing protein [Phenylobacterium sp.]
MQRFILQENIKLLRGRLSTATTGDDRRRVQPILAAMERELALLDSLQDGVLSRGAKARRARNEQARAELTAWFHREFDGAPTLASLIDPAPGLVFCEVNETYCLSTGLSRDEIVGHSLFTRFPENPDDPAADGLHKFYTSLRKVAETGETDTMELLRYDVQDADGQFRERYWRPVTSPLRDSAGSLVFLLQQVEEVTEEILRLPRSA